MAKSVNEPFGFEQGDPLIISTPEGHLIQLAEALQVRAYYMLPFSSLLGRRHEKIIVIKYRILTLYNYDRFKKWLYEEAALKCPPSTLAQNRIFWV